ncbi:hypothetical protein [Maribellus sediminis]|uniref:hypothetical protein n=1 Tax=Maribellus sediminis TaxID=2696285 RepID=UPI001431EFC6|nr:hypothetical protein [Maribellus sediminis]
MKKLFTGILLLTFAFLVKITTAQEDAPKPRYIVWEAKVEIAQMEKLLSALDAVHDYMKELDYPYPELIQHAEGHVWASAPIESMADLDKMREADDKVWGANQKKSEELGKMFEDSYTKVGGMVLELQPELSIMPEEQSTQTTGQRFRLYEKFYVKNGKGKEFSDLVKKYCELRKKLGYNQPFYTFHPMLAGDMSVVYFISEMGNSPAENLKMNDEFWAKAGDEGAELFNVLKETVSSMDQYFGVIDFDNSYFPEN